MVHALKEMHEYEHEESPNRPHTHLHHHCFDEKLLFQLAILTRAAGHSEISNMFVLLNGYCIMPLKLFPFPQKV